MPKSKIVEPVWRPARHSQGGTVFCSPSCGFRCSRAAYDRANLEAVKLCSALGKGWEPEVWENCGWHFKASKGVASVHATLDGSARAGTYKIVGYQMYFNSKPQLIHACKAKVPLPNMVRAVQRRARRLARAMIADAEALTT